MVLVEPVTGSFFVRLIVLVLELVVVCPCHIAVLRLLRLRLELALLSLVMQILNQIEPLVVVVPTVVLFHLIQLKLQPMLVVL